ncbi:hypothetical protein BKA67DRAFT_654468 [Truncatella angustata]|uniref:Uncharacterized protein n=1 Tax=Truncatella angustata TaxID=152316 RepID=A0A9P8UZP9_9PEZI|nr:uncharacterized protein BKA67DRAFT_654468 [Truncatella angustata]KAH6661348.1 hypothetical protein BKA67DRAFT_654468 [Truncatella angustata]KAH8202175.1 hypothetical protein TruAng_003650 [Truncatella angustata]
MSTEDMEISMDFGHQVSAEDIDIDIEFAAGQNDQDLELGDYNQADEFQHFNSDNRDELMAEDDDASYAMADADEISYNETATAASDYDIAIGDTDVFSWQEHHGTDNLEQVSAVVQTQQLNGTQVKGDDLISAVIEDSGAQLQDQPTRPETVFEDSLEAVESVQIFESASTKTPNPEELANPNDIVTQDSEVGSTAVDEGHAALADNVETEADQQQQNLQSSVTLDARSIEDIHDAAGFESTHDTESPENAHDGIVDRLDNKPDAEQVGADHVEPALIEEHDENGNDLEAQEDEIGYDQLEDEDDPSHGSLASSSAADEHSKEQGPAEQYTAEGDGNGEDNDFTAGNYQLDDESFEHIENQNTQETEESEQRQDASPEPSEQAESVEFAGHDLGDTDNTNTGNVNQEIASVAKRHILVVRYGETDYQLFASDPDDDPSNYFFKDTSALDLPLGEFLSGIRSVISEEVSPLDELVLHIDGLGLEFGESMTNQILEEYTFGHILSLYDSLVQNDANKEVIDAPELYMYLMVRPNCLQRLLALQVQAASGRCLTDVAVYREASPAQDDADDGHVLAVSPDFIEDELYDDEDEDELEEHESPDHTENAQHDVQPSQSEDTEAEASQHGDEHGDETQEFADDVQPSQSEDTEAEASQHGDEHGDETQEFADDDDEDAVDYGDLDLTPSQQGNAPLSLSSPLSTHCTGEVTCLCDPCWYQQIEDDFAPLTSSDPALINNGGVLFAQAHFKHDSSDANNFYCEDFPNDITNETTTEANAPLANGNGTTNDADTVPSAHDEQHDDPPSESTSATATLDGNPDDEIDYDENDQNASVDIADAEYATPALPAAKLPAPLDEEITWESENEEARNEQPATSQPSEQVSTTPGKRTRSGSDAAASAGDRKDVKRQRS